MNAPAKSEVNAWVSKIEASLIKDTEAEKAEREKRQRDNAAANGRVIKLAKDLASVFQTLETEMKRAGLSEVRLKKDGGLSFFGKDGKRIRPVKVEE